MEALASHETLVYAYQTTWLHILDNNNLNTHCGENPKSHTGNIILQISNKTSEENVTTLLKNR